MIRLSAKDQNTATFTTLDTSGTEVISLNYSVAEPGKVMGRQSPYSGSFNLPFTNTNDVFFAAYFEVDLTDGNFNAAKKTEVYLYEDGAQLIFGSLQLRAVRLKARVYEVNIVGESGDLFSRLGTKTLEDCFTADDGTVDTGYNFDMTAQNIKDSQNTTASDITDGNEGKGVIVVPIIDHGLMDGNSPFWSDNASNSGLTSSSDPCPLAGHDFKPAINIDHLFRKIVNQAGFQIQSTFMTTTDWTDLYMTLSDHTERHAAPFNQGFRIRKTNTQNLGVTVSTLTFQDSSSTGFYNPGVTPFWQNSTTPHHFLPQTDGDYTLEVSLKITATTNAPQIQTCYIIQNGVELATSQAVFLGTGALDDPTSVTHAFTRTVTCQAGLAVTIEARCAGIAYGPNSDPPDGCQVTAGSTVRLLGITEAFDQKCLVPKCMPPIQQKAFVKDLAQRFNLVIASEEESPGTLIIEPYNDWIAAGRTAGSIDWSEKLDVSKEQNVKPTSHLRSKRLEFADKEAPDVLNKYVQDTTGATFNAFNRTIADDFATGETKNDPIFAPFHTTTVMTLAGDPYTDEPALPVARFYALNEDGTTRFESGPPRLFYFSQFASGSFPSLFIDGVEITAPRMALPFTTTVSSDALQAGSRMLSWNTTALPFNYGGFVYGSEMPTRGYFEQYWREYFACIYSDEAREYTAYFYLRPDDIRRLAFNRPITVQGHRYRLTKVENYQAGADAVTKCTFLRDIQDLNFGECDAVLQSQNLDGTTTWIQGGSTTSDPGYFCCVDQGFFYDNTTNECVWIDPDLDTVTPGGDDGTTPVGGDGGDTGTDSGNGFTNGMPPGGHGTNPVPELPLPTAQTRREVRFLQDGGYIVHDTFRLYTQTTDNRAVLASSPGRRPDLNRILVPEGFDASIEIEARSVQVDGTAGTRGDVSSQQFRGTLKGTTRSVSIGAVSGVARDDGSVGSRSVSGSFARISPDFQISCTGETDKTLEWTLDITLVRVFNAAVLLRPNTLLLENGRPMRSELGIFISDET